MQSLRPYKVVLASRGVSVQALGQYATEAEALMKAQQLCRLLPDAEKEIWVQRHLAGKEMEMIAVYVRPPTLSPAV